MRARIRIRRWRGLIHHELHYTRLALLHYRHEAAHVAFIMMLTFGHSVPSIAR